MFQFLVELPEAPLVSFQVRVPTVSLPTTSEISRTVSVDLPPRKTVVSQQSTMVAASSL